MNVRDLIARLLEMPQDAEVFHLWDGEPRTKIEVVWFAPSGKVITSDVDEPCYSPQNRPAGYQDENLDYVWTTGQRQTGASK